MRSVFFKLKAAFCAALAVGISFAAQAQTPQVTGVGTRNDPNGVYVTYNKAMDGVTALLPLNYELTNSSGGVIISSAAFIGSGSNIVRLAVPALTLGSTYTLTVSNVTDQTAAFISPNPTTVSFVHGVGIVQAGLTLKRYTNITGGAVADLTGNAQFPCSPDYTDPNIATMEYSSFIPGHNDPVTRADPGLENYGAWIYGQFVAPATGNYTFGLSSDDASTLYLSSDSDPAHKTQVLAQPGWNGDRDFTGRISNPIALTAGQQYYMEVLFKEGGGGDHVTVAIQKPGDPAITNGQTGIERSLFATNYSANCGRSQFSTLGPVTIAVSPTNQTVVDGNSVTFYVQPDGSPNYTFQWYSNGVAVAGGNAASLTFVARPSANGSTYYAVVSNDFSSATSSVATLTVTLNPQLLAVSVRNDNATNVYVTFSQNVALTGTYTIDNAVTVNSISYGTTHSEVILTTSPLAPDTAYTLTVAGETRETTGEPTVPNPATGTFRYGFGAFCSDFTTMPPGAALYNNAVTGSGIRADDGTGTNMVVHLTDDGNNGAYGKLFISNRTGGAVLNTLSARWRTRIGGELGGHADGMSFNWANNLAANGNFVDSENGEGTGVSFVIDTWDAGSGPDTGIEITWQDARIAFMHIPRSFEGNSNFLTLDYFVDTSATVSSSGLATFTYNGNTISGTIPGWTGIANGAYAISARTGGENDNMWIDDLCINNFTLGPLFFTLQPVDTTVAEGQTATFTAAVDGSPPYSFQWFTNGAPVPGANSSTYRTPPTTAAYNGMQVYVVASNGFSTVTSSNATLTVLLNPRVVSVFSRRDTEVHIIYTRPVALASGTYEFDNGGFEQDRGYGTNRNEVIITNDAPLTANTTYTVTITDVADEFNPANIISPNPTVVTFRHGYGSVCADFAAGLPPGATVSGSAAVSGGVLHITDALNGQQGTFFLPDQNGGQPMDRLIVRFRTLIGSTPGTRIADGMSFNVASDITSASNYGEEGAGSGLTITFDTWDNNAPDTAPAIEVRYKGVTVATQAMAGIRDGGRAPSGPFLFDANGNPLSLATSNQFVNFLLTVAPDGKLDLYFKDQIIFQNLQLPNYTPFVGANYGFGARTGGANENAWIDDLCINAFSLGEVVITRQPSNATVNENPPGRASFSVDVDGLPPYTAQWYSNGVPVPGATALAYTTPPLNRSADGAGYFVIVSNIYNSVTSQVATVTIVRDTNAPTILFASSDCSSNVYVRFSETLNPASANNPTNYTINNGVTVTAASLYADGRLVVLTVSPPINPNNASVLTVNGVTDNGPFPNATVNARAPISAKAPVNASGANNLIVVEAEDYDVNRSPASGTPDSSWVLASSLPGFVGSGYMDSVPNSGVFGGNTPDLFTNASRLDYCVNVPVAGTYYFWARGSTANDGGNNSLHFGIDGVSPDEFSRRVGNRISNWGGDAGNVNAFGWTRDANGVGADQIARISIATPGVHTLNIWMREDGLKLDRFLLTTDAAFTVTTAEAGPAATGRTATRNLRIVKNTDGSATVTWDGTGWTLQATTELKPDPSQTVWQNTPYTSPLVIPPGFFGTGNTNVFFRLCSP